MQIKYTALIAALIVPGMMLGTAHAEKAESGYDEKDSKARAATFMGALPTNAFHASELIGTDVQSTAEDGDDIGEVSDLLLNEDGEVKGVVISVGGVMGIGDKKVAVEWDAVEVSKDEDGDYVMRINTTKEALEDAKEYDEDETEERDQERRSSTAR